jgi:phage gpG-like protein
MTVQEFVNRLRALRDEVRHLPQDIAVLAAEEFDKNFERHGFFQDNGWTASNRISGYARHGMPAGSILIQTGTLRRSIQYVYDSDSIRFTSNVEYAQIHNEGGIIQHPGGTAYTKVNGRTRWIRNTVAAGGSFPRTKAHPIPIPKRQFIGEHPVLRTEITELVQNTFYRILND